MHGNALILASASPRRAELLRQLGLRFRVVACDLTEPSDKPAARTPGDWAEALAYFKARRVAELHPETLTLGADTIVACRGRVLGKPRDLDDARRMLELQAGVASAVLTGVCLCRADARGTRRLLFRAQTLVWMRDDAQEREHYLASGDWAGKAGAYGIQDVGDRLIERIDGSFSNVVGLPIERVQVALRVASKLSDDGP